MLIGYSDASHKDEIISLGYCFLRPPAEEDGKRQFVEMGHRVLNERRLPHDYGSTRAEYRALISAARRALDYDDTHLMLYTDSKTLAQTVTEGCELDESGYFHHAFHSFAERFEAWHVSYTHRDNNEIAHNQARIGMKLADELEVEI